MSPGRAQVSSRDKSGPAKVAQHDLRLLRALERISSIVTQTYELDVMLESVLDEMLSIFDCDRAWLLYPCDPDAPSWKVPMECTRPEWPGAGTMADIPMTVDAAAVFAAAAASEEPVTFNREKDPGFRDADYTRQFHLQSQMTFCIRPKIGKPWLLGIHNCARLNRYSKEEQSIFKAVGNRIADSLTTFLVLQDLKKSQESFRVLVDHAPEAIFVLDAALGRFVDMNQNTEKLFGRSRAELFAGHWLDFSPRYQAQGQPTREYAADIMRQTLGGGAPVFEWLIEDSAGNPVECEMRLVTLPSDDHPLIRGSISDITERKRADKQMRILSGAVQQTADSIAITNVEGVIEYINPAFTEITGYPEEALIGKTHRLLNSGRHSQEFYKTLWHTVLAGEVFSSVFINRKRDGTLYYEEKTITPLVDRDGSISHFISSGRDITERLNTQEKLDFLAHHDVLTELPNRALFADHLEKAIYRAIRKGALLGLIFLDLDRFKVINDTLGHSVGDESLQIFAERLRGWLRANDTVARLGGDEFGVIVENVQSETDLAILADTLVKNISQSIEIGSQELYLTASIGISVFPEDGRGAQDLLKNAEIAMYEVKEKGKNNYQFYHRSMSDQATERLVLETRLRRALERDEFRIYYQPKVDLQTGRLVGMEALLRWQSPRLGLVSPAEFIPLLEETGLIGEVGEWVVTTACTQFVRWLDQGLEPGTIAINLSPRQFEYEGLAGKIVNAVRASGLPAERVELEITESLLMRNYNNALKELNELNESGFSLALDDFGTGYSSLSYLKCFPIHTLKIDRSFIRDIPGNENDCAIVDTIIAMAGALQLKVVAEGIEDQRQLEYLRHKECVIGQGFYFGYPVSREEVGELLRSIKESQSGGQ